MGHPSPVDELMDGANLIRHSLLSVTGSKEWDSARKVLLDLLDILVSSAKVVLAEKKGGDQAGG